MAVAEENNKSILVAGLTSAKEIKGYHGDPISSPSVRRKGPTADAWVVSLK